MKLCAGGLGKPPKFYDKLLEKRDPSMYATLKENRECALAVSPKFDRTPSRLTVRETVKLAELGQFKRRYEIG